MPSTWDAERIRSLMERVDGGMTTVQLAARLHVHQVTVERWLRGKSKPAGWVCEKLDRMVQRAGLSESLA